MITLPDITAALPWYGSNRMNAARVGELLADCKWVGIAFAGSLAEVFHLQARTIVANDLHRLAINLYRVIADPQLRGPLYRSLRRVPFHQDVLAESQRICRAARQPDPELPPDLNLARAYFLACWCNRSALAGTKGELRGNLPIRWEPGGGDSCKRFVSAVRSIILFGRTFARCNFCALDFRPFLKKCQDKTGHGIYVDPPWFGPGDLYLHGFTEPDHRELALMLGQYDQARIVCRFYDVPLIRELYDDGGQRWKWHEFAGRKQTNAPGPEVLIVRN